MIIIAKELAENKDELVLLIDNEKILINSMIESQKRLKNILLGYMQNLVVSSENISTDYADSVLDILNNVKNSLNTFKINMDLLNNLLKLLDDMSSDPIEDSIIGFNNSFLVDTNTVFQNTVEIENVLASVLPYLSLVFSDLKQLESDSDDTISANNSSEPVADSAFLAENTLIISETEGKVVLPYCIDSVNALLKNNSDKYTCIGDVINKEYTLSLDYFKNTSLARFREGFKLMRKKEKKSIVESFDLGMELAFNYNLHPAVICACSSLSELDSYLDYLDNKKSSSFDYFPIVFAIPPMVK